MLMKTFITLKKPIIKYLLYWTPAILIFIFTSILLLGKALNFTPGLALLSEVIIAKELEFDNHSNIKINSGLMWLDGKALTINLDQIEIIYDERYKITIPQVKLTFNI